MKGLGIRLAVVLALTCSASSAHTAPAAAHADAARWKAALAAHELTALDGTKVSWASLSGQVVVVNFWATWCKPCRRELPALDRLDHELRGSGARVLAVSLDLDRVNVRRFVKANRIALTVCPDGPDGLAKILDLDAVPMTVVLDRRGEIAYTMRGSDEASLAEMSGVARRLAVSTGTAANVEAGQ